MFSFAKCSFVALLCLATLHCAHCRDNFEYSIDGSSSLSQSSVQVDGLEVAAGLGTAYLILYIVSPITLLICCCCCCYWCCCRRRNQTVVSNTFVVGGGQAAQPPQQVFVMPGFDRQQPQLQLESDERAAGGKPFAYGRLVEEL